MSGISRLFNGISGEACSKQLCWFCACLPPMGGVALALIVLRPSEIEASAGRVSPTKPSRGGTVVLHNSASGPAFAARQPKLRESATSTASRATVAECATPIRRAQSRLPSDGARGGLPATAGHRSVCLKREPPTALSWFACATGRSKCQPWSTSFTPVSSYSCPSWVEPRSAPVGVPMSTTGAPPTPNGARTGMTRQRCLRPPRSAA